MAPTSTHRTVSSFPEWKKQKRQAHGILIVGFAFTLLGSLAFANVAKNSPALNSKLRTNTFDTDWRVSVPSAHYNPGTYYYSIASRFLQADTMALLGGASSLPSEQSMVAFAASAQRLLELSLQEKPANASAWTALGWVHLMLGDVALANRALMTSHELAPINLGNAPSRIALSSSLSLYSDDVETNALLADFALLDMNTLRVHDREYYDVLAQDLEDGEQNSTAN